MSLIAKCRTIKQLNLINFLLVLAGIIAMLGCEHDSSVNQVLRLAANDEVDYRTIAWNYLSERERTTVIGGPDSGRVLPATWQEKDVVSVVFSTTEDALLGAIIIYIDPQSKKVLGSAPRF
jgi:hypothetical protein